MIKNNKNSRLGFLNGRLKRLKSNRSGITWLAENVGDLVLEVLGVIVLIGLLVLFILLITKSSDIDKAGKYADLIKGRMEQINKDAATKTFADLTADYKLHPQEELILAPEGWYVGFFEGKISPRPIDCSTLNAPCICICASNDIATCNQGSKGACRNVNLDNNKISTVKFFEDGNKIGYVKIKGVLALEFGLEQKTDVNTNVEYLQLNMTANA